MLRRRIKDMRRLLVKGGTLIVTIDGWPRRIGLDRLFWPDGSLRSGKTTGIETLRATIGAHVSGYRSLFRRHGFDTVRFYVLLPLRAEPSIVFCVDDEKYQLVYRSVHLAEEWIGSHDRGTSSWYS